MIDKAIPAGHHALIFIEPGEQAFDFPASPIAPEDPIVLRLGSAAVSAMRRDQLNALASKPLIERIAVVGTIPDKSLGSSHGEGLSEGSFDKGDFMWRSRSRVHGEWKTRSVCNSHELRTLAPLGLSNCEAPFFATTKVPSIKHSERLILPRSSRSRASASSIACSTPWRTQRLKRRKHVEPEGKRSGKSAQAAPVRRTQRMPLSTARSLCVIGLPRPSARSAGFGIRGPRIAHCSSVSSSRFPMPKNLAWGSREVQRYL
jgi:hypothetical protein